MDRLSGLDSTLFVASVAASGVPLSALRDREGRIRINASSQSKLDGIEQCDEVSTPMISTCKRSSDVVFQGECVRLPELRLQVRNAEFIEPPDDFLEYR